MGDTVVAVVIRENRKVPPDTENKNHQNIKKSEMAISDYFERRLDDKKRLTIPAELRHEFGQDGEVVITRGFGDYLHLYTKTVWDEQVEPALKGSILDEQVADLNVRMRTGRVVSKMDAKQGRITLEQHLLDYAGITKDVVAVRAGAYWRLMAR